MTQQTYGEWMRSNPPIPNLTAVEWLEENIQSDMTFMEVLSLIRQAKQMEKEQIIDAHYQGYRNDIGTTEISEQYYNEKYGK